MVDAQQIFESLIKDPNHYFLGEKAVEQEAIRRARQFHNNEKALAMALQNSAVAKLSTFLSKALNPATKRNILNLLTNEDVPNSPAQYLRDVRGALSSFFDQPDFYTNLGLEAPENIDPADDPRLGWHNTMPNTDALRQDKYQLIGEDELASNETLASAQNGDIYTIGRQVFGLVQVLDFLKNQLRQPESTEASIKAEALNNPPAGADPQVFATTVEHLLSDGFADSGRRVAQSFVPWMDMLKRWPDHPLVEQ